MAVDLVAECLIEKCRQVKFTGQKVLHPLEHFRIDGYRNFRRGHTFILP